MENTNLNFIPSSSKELKDLGIEQLDVIFVTGDAYIDHPSFGVAILARLLESLKLKVGIIAAPNTQDDLRDFKKLGKPRLFFGVTAGAMDSMVNKYTAGKRLRSEDAYLPQDYSQKRPDHASLVYSKILKSLFPQVPVVLGGVENSLRRVTHYDYWQNKLLPSFLFLSGADLLVYGMGEKAITELCHLLQKGIPFSSLTTIPQTALLRDKDTALPKNKKWEDEQIYSHEECLKDSHKYALNFKRIEEESNCQSSIRFLQNIEGQTLIINPPFPPLSTKELDKIYDLPFSYKPHPRYEKKGKIAAYEMIKNSVTIHRGCFGGCSFCTISAHQGKQIQSRSSQSIIKELEKICKLPSFKGTISDLGGPSANMYQMQGKDQSICQNCKKPSCIFPKICPNLENNHGPLLKLYEEAEKVKNIKHIFIGSGLRYDLMLDKSSKYQKENQAYTQKIITDHVSGRLKVAPEHTEDEVLNVMRKPSFKLFEEFKTLFQKISLQQKKDQDIVPYFISSHPACKLQDMAKLALKTKNLGYRLEQIQDFTPTPMTLSTVIYYSGFNPYAQEKVYCAKNKEEKKDQQRFFFWYKKENRDFIERTLKKLKLGFKL